MQEKTNDIEFTSESIELPNVKEVEQTTLSEEISSEDETLITEEEPKELTEEEKHELFIKQLKESKIRFKPIKQDGNITTNQFPTSYKKKRQKKNKAQKASRRNSRK
jgi:hypothetical protein